MTNIYLILILCLLSFLGGFVLNIYLSRKNKKIPFDKRVWEKGGY